MNLLVVELDYFQHFLVLFNRCSGGITLDVTYDASKVRTRNIEQTWNPETVNSILTGIPSNNTLNNGKEFLLLYWHVIILPNLSKRQKLFLSIKNTLSIMNEKDVKLPIKEWGNLSVISCRGRGSCWAIESPFYFDNCTTAPPNVMGLQHVAKIWLTSALHISFRKWVLKRNLHDVHPMNLSQVLVNFGAWFYDFRFPFYS